MLFEDWWTEEREEAFKANYKIDTSLAIETLARDAVLAGMFKGGIMLFEDWWTEEREEAFKANYKIDTSLAIETLARDAVLAGMFKDAQPVDSMENKDSEITPCAWCGYPVGYWAEKRTVHCEHP